LGNCRKGIAAKRFTQVSQPADIDNIDRVFEEEATMPVAIGLSEIDPETLKKFRVWFKIYGVVLIILGLASILLPQVASLATAIMVGWLLVAGGIFGLISDFSAGTKAPGFWWNLLTAALYLLAGIVLLVNPVAAVLTLTIVLAAYLLATGVTKVVTAFHYKSVIPKAWLWVLFSAIVDIVLSGIIIAGLPGTAIWVIGLMVGINLLFTGIALLASAFYCQSMESPASGSQPAKV
jgi:uncharacterized membrane protein HdeD (DUF308 family)